MHSVREVTEGLYWVGANDHRLHLFENIHPIPLGVSYNAYLMLDGDVSVLVDTVDWSACRQMMENIDHVLNGRKLDYLLINHMEPDHGASIEEVLRRWPACKVIASEKAFMMMRQFGFQIDGHEQITVAEGDTYTFGKHTVAFVGAPMVHWPEAIVTFDTTNGVLFSADAFGSFIALDGKLFSDEVDFDRDWIDEARRYLVNIVGKYGPQVQTLLKKASGIIDKINFVCPLHGPVWKKKDLMYFVGKYDKWSRYEPEVNGVVIAYASMYGNTESAAQALAAALVQKGVKDVVVRDVSNTHVSYLIADTFKYSHVVLASVTYNLNIFPVMHTFLDDMRMLNVRNRTFAIVENGTWACKSGDLMEKFINDNLVNCEVLNERISMASALLPGKEPELETLADAIVESLKAREKK